MSILPWKNRIPAWTNRFPARLACSLRGSRSTTHVFITLTVLSVGSVANSSSADAQSVPGESVIVAVPVSFPDLDARAIVVRERGQEFVILRPDEVRPEALAMALAVLRRARREPLEEGRGQMLPITGFVLREPLPQQRRDRLQEALDRLEGRPLTEVGRFGPGRWIRYRIR